MNEKKMIYEGELKILEALWEEGDMTAKGLAIKLEKSVGWRQTTTYTVINRSVGKGLIKRLGTDFTCRAAITQEEARKQEAELLVNKLFDGSPDKLIASLLGRSKLTTSQIEKLRNILQEFDAG